VAHRLPKQIGSNGNDSPWPIVKGARMSTRRLRYAALFLFTALLASTLAACSGTPQSTTPANTAQPVVQTVLVEGTPQTVVVTATPLPPTPEPAPQLQDTIVIGAWQEPRNFLEYANGQAIRAEIDLLHRPRWVMRQDFKFSPNPNLLDGDLPTFENGGAKLVDVTVAKDQPLFDATVKRVISATAETTTKQLVVTGKLKAGLKWSDGEPLTASDFIYSWKLSCDPDSGALDQTYCPYGVSPGSGGILADYKALDDTTLEATFTPGVLDPIYQLIVFGPQGGPMPQHQFLEMLPADILKDERATGGTSAVPVTWGPYQMKEWKKGESITFAPNTHWSGEPAKTPNVIYRFFTDAVAVATAVIAGEIDSSSGQTGVDVDQYPYLESVAKNGDISFQVDTQTARFEMLYFNFYDPKDKELKQLNPLLSEYQVRKAIVIALNRQQMVDTIFYGQSSLVEQPHLPQMVSYDLAQGKLPEFDPEGAKKLLDEAGWVAGDDGIRTKNGARASFTIVTTSGVPLRQKALQMVQANLNDVGIEVNLNFQPSSVFISSDVLYSRAFEAALFANTFSVLDPGNWWYSIAACDQIPTPANGFAGANYAGWCDEAASDAVTSANFLTLEPEPRKEAWNLALKQYFDNGYPLIPLFIRPTMLATAPNLMGPKLNGTEYFTYSVATWELRDQ
jgi:peptide/nickel transport system substrate-binding protein